MELRGVGLGQVGGVLGGLVEDEVVCEEGLPSTYGILSKMLQGSLMH